MRPLDQVCAGCRVSGYWKGYPCGAHAMVTFEGKRYCDAHYSIALHNPLRMQKARDARARQEARTASH